MEEKSVDSIMLPDGSVKSFEKCEDNIKHTRDIELYLDTLYALRDRYLIILSVKDTPGELVSEPIFEKVHKLGFSKLTRDRWRTYIGVVDKGELFFDKSNGKVSASLEFAADLDAGHISVVSQTWKYKTSIKINNTDYSLDGRGWNIVVYDYTACAVIDSSVFDSNVENPTFYHMNFELKQDYFDSHFFVSEKYKEGWIIPYKRSYYSNAKPGVKEVENGIILPNKAIDGRVYGGVCDENLNFIAGHSTHNKEFGTRVRYISDGYKVLQKDLKYVDETVVYGGPVLDHPGHLMIELFANRIWWYLNNPDSNFKVAVILSTISHIEHQQFIREFFELYGIAGDRLMFVTEPTKFKSVIVPDQCLVPIQIQETYSYTDEYLQVFKKMSSQIEASPYKKIYFSKSKVSRGNFFGEQFFIDYFKNKGYKIINPEDCTLQEKISYMLGADEFATFMGTNAIYSIFCKPSTMITLFSRTNWYSHGYLAAVYEAIHNKNLYCVDVALGFFHENEWNGLFWVGITHEFKKYAKKVFNEEIVTDPKEYLQENLYKYFCRVLDFYSHPTYFNSLKSQKIITILQNMSEVFFGKEFDVSKLDLTTNEDVLKKQINMLTSDLKKSEKCVIELEESLTQADNSLKAQAEKLKNEQKKTAELLSQLQQMQKHNTILKEQIEGYEHSRSWRITKPLRSIAWFFRGKNK